MKKPHLMDLYTDFLTTSPSMVSATLLSDILNKQHSHDSITRMLSQEILDQKSYWHAIKPNVRQIEIPQGVIAIDDTLEEKPHSDENELICWHYDHSQGLSVKGINIVTFTYINSLSYPLPVKLPVAFELVRKDSTQTKTVKKERYAAAGQIHHPNQSLCLYFQERINS